VVQIVGYNIAVALGGPRTGWAKRAIIKAFDMAPIIEITGVKRKYFV
jgi:hypothetical protein